MSTLISNIVELWSYSGPGRKNEHFTKRKAPKHLNYSIAQLNGLEHLNLTWGNPYPLIVDPVHYGANYDRCRNIPVDPILLRLFVMRLSYRRTTSRDTVASEGSEGRQWLPEVLQGTPNSHISGQVYRQVRDHGSRTTVVVPEAGRYLKTPTSMAIQDPFRVLCFHTWMMLYWSPGLHESEEWKRWLRLRS